MGDTVFNIFNSHVSDPVLKNIIPRSLGENVIVNKLNSVAKGTTPSKINKNISTPKFNDPKKKSFLKNEGASAQIFHPVFNGKKKTNEQSLSKNSLQVYEDNILKPKLYDEDEEMIKMECNRKPVADDDLYDDEFDFSGKQLDKLIFKFRPSTPTPSFNNLQTKMIQIPELQLDEDPFLECDIIDCDDRPNLDENIFI